MDDAALWTLDELSELAAAALRVDYAGQPSRRIREVPDRRTIRWYTTIGLLDRPAAMRGRTALYGRRHLAQLVAVKRLQAAGRALVDVQSELLGATDATLESIARIPADLALMSTRAGADLNRQGDLLTGGSANAQQPHDADSLGADAAEAVGTVEVVEAVEAVEAVDRADGSSAADRPETTRTARSARFWAAAPAVAENGDGHRAADRHDGGHLAGSGRPAGSERDADRGRDRDSDVGADRDSAVGAAESCADRAPREIPALRLGSGVTLLLGSAGRALTAEDARLIDAAARPLLDLLFRRGLDVPGLGRETQ